MHLHDEQRPQITFGLLLLIALAFAAGRLTVGHLANDPAREEAAAIHAYRSGHTTDAHQLFAQLAKHGDTTAAYYLGEMDQYGDGTARDGAQAVKWLTIAAKAGHARAARQLGLLYLNGQVQVQDLAAARQWLTRAANAGDAVALRHLGTMTARGLGGAADPVAAYADYAAATSLGDTDAASLRDAEAARLSAAQQVEGQRQAARLAAHAKHAAHGTPGTQHTPKPAGK
ncbi:sel1 repeat family protein [Nitrogeniibacter mangrovi]|uniref:Sel1 repeat family protein n=1 Tax=Nitrogeniibacter mangrovi TaxID=2016596 RepID=A0A6C1B087_9RHOO|nr:SEL1-like repeat protein [Nitrogeniibacter mangrovi]QID16409.1 sel1 repeat family protein [Nitrogeniibacter mangrovi]